MLYSGGGFIAAIIEKAQKKKSLVELGLSALIGYALVSHLGPIAPIAGQAMVNVISDIFPDLAGLLGSEFLDKQYEKLIEKLQESGLKEVDVIVLKAYEKTIEELKTEYKKRIPLRERLQGIKKSPKRKERDVLNWIDCMDRKIHEKIKEPENEATLGVDKIHRIHEEDAIEEVVGFLKETGCGWGDDVERFIRDEFIPKFQENITKTSVRHPALMALLLKEILGEISEENEKIEEIVMTLEDYLELERGGIEKRQEEHLEELLRKPFAGRENEIREILEFIKTKRSGRLIVTGPAGVGKSSILAHVVDELSGDESTAMAFYFFSSAEGMRDPLEALRYMILSIGVFSFRTGKTTPALSTDRPERLSNVLRGLMEELRGKNLDKKLVIVIDGLDEADPTEFERTPCPFPEVLPDNIYLIMGVRGGRDNPEIPGTSAIKDDWIGKAEFIELMDLSRESIEELVREVLGDVLGSEDSAEQIASIIHERTKGYPLYVSYLLDELKSLSIDEIFERVREIPESFEDYIEEELERMERVEDGDTVDYLFAFLAIAKEPLSPEEISRILGVRKRKLRRLGHDVKRWLLILKDREERWALQHEELREVFGKLLEDEVAEVRERLLEYCSDWEGKEYCVKHYPEHLFEAGKYEELIELAKDDSFRDAQRSVSANLVFRTLELAMDAAANIGNISKIIELAFLLNKEHNRYLSILEYYLQYGLEETLRLIERDPNEKDRFLSVLLLSAYAGQLGRRTAVDVLEKGKHFVRKYEPVIDQLKELWKILPEPEMIKLTIYEFGTRNRSEALVEIAKAFAKAGKLEEALNTVEKIEILWLRSEALVEVAKAFAKVENLDEASKILNEALNVSEKIKNPRSRFRASVEIAEGFAAVEEYDKALNILNEALKTAEKLKDKWYRLRALIEIAKVLTGVGEHNKALNILDEAYEGLKRVEKTEKPWYISYALIKIAKVLTEVGEHNKALNILNKGLETAEKIEDPLIRSKVLMGIVEVFLKAEKTDEALKTAKKIEIPWYFSEALTEIAKLFVKAGKNDKALEILDEALNTIEKIEILRLRAKVLAEIAGVFLKAGKADEALNILNSALTILDEALKTEEKIEHPLSRFKALVDVAKAFAEAGKLDEALRVAEKIEDSEYHSKVLAEIAEVFAGTGRIDKALKTVGKIEKPLYISYSLMRIAEVLARAGNPREALTIAEKIEDPLNRYHALMEISRAFLKLGKIDDALKTAEKIEDSEYHFEELSEYRFEALMGIANAFAEAGEHDKALNILDEALNTLEKIKDISYHSRALMEIAKVIARIEEVDEVIQEAEKIKDPLTRSYLLRGIAEVLAETGKSSEALNTVEKIEILWLRSEALVEVAKAFAKIKKFDEALNILDEALRTAEKIEDPWSRFRELAEIAKAFVEAGKLDEALRVAEKIEGPGNSFEALREVAKAFAEAGNLDEALKIAEKIENSLYRYEALTEIAKLAGRLESRDLRILGKILKAASFLGPWELLSVVANYAGSSPMRGDVLRMTYEMVNDLTRDGNQNP